MSLPFADLITNRGRPAARITPAEPLAVLRGTEIGVFNLGSTVVLLVADSDLLPAVVVGDLVHMGQALWRRE
jgi:hypothetical protein